MNAPDAKLTWRLASAWPARGAIAIVQVRGEVAAIDELLRSLGAGEVRAGRVAVRGVAGIDTCVLGRFDEQTLLIFPHAGKRMLELLCAALEKHGAARAEGWSARELFPEAADEVEARMLAAISEAASPLAIDVLLDQPRRWREVERIGEVDAETARALGRLIRPALVAAVGLPNVGKSSLLNALAGRTLSVEADVPGTTRDHVGATLDLGGVVVRWMDCPGFSEAESDQLQVESQRIAREMAGAADLLVVCGDAVSGFPAEELLPRGPARVPLALRTDLGLPDGWAGEGPEVSLRGEGGVGGVRGLEQVVEAVREGLVPRACVEDARAWRFWDVG